MYLPCGAWQSKLPANVGVFSSLQDPDWHVTFSLLHSENPDSFLEYKAVESDLGKDPDVPIDTSLRHAIMRHIFSNNSIKDSMKQKMVNQTL
jgi:hypothetical protein